MRLEVGGAEVVRIAAALEELVSLLRPVLRPAGTEGGQTFHTGLPSPNDSAEPPWVGITNEFRDATREQMESYYGRTLTEEEEQDLEARFEQFVPTKRTSSTLYHDGFSKPSNEEDDNEGPLPDGSPEARE